MGVENGVKECFEAGSAGGCTSKPSTTWDGVDEAAGALLDAAPDVTVGDADPDSALLTTPEDGVGVLESTGVADSDAVIVKLAGEGDKIDVDAAGCEADKGVSDAPYAAKASKTEARSLSECIVYVVRNVRHGDPESSALPTTLTTSAQGMRGEKEGLGHGWSLTG